jgi:hypothetical protein
MAEMSEVPQAMRQTVKYFLLSTGREGITEAELVAVKALEALHYPARVNQEIDKALERFKKKARAPSSLTFEYLFDALKGQFSRKPAKKGPAIPEPAEAPWPYSVAYEDVAALWDRHMPGVEFLPAPEPTRQWRRLFADRIAENPGQRDSLAWWEARFREIDDSDFASGRSPASDGKIWRLELSALLESEEKLQNLATGKYRNRRTIQVQEFVPVEPREIEVEVPI